MPDSSLLDILIACHELEKSADEIYQALARQETDNSRADFWRSLAIDEQEHASFWEKLIELANRNMVPQVFENPSETLAELGRIRLKISDLRECWEKNPSDENAVSLSCFLEFHLLDPALISLYETMRRTADLPTPIDSYESHLGRFIDGLSTRFVTHVSIEILGDALLRVWRQAMQLTEQLHTDRYTGLLNRYGFFRTLWPMAYTAQRNESTIGIMMFDVDYHRMIRETYGHQTAERVVSLVADVIRSNLRKSDLLGRYGNDEFIIYLSPVESQFLATIADNMRRRIRQESEQVIPVTVSIGAVYGKVASNVEETITLMISKAEKNMMQAQYTGKNRVVVSSLDQPGR